ncbi:MAG: barstar family protein [Anaerovoracaceae bacterium]|nr:barstar family protein [Bacillota bacterium]MDY2670960.1 barstar family protein [Anaerovoracaceae bacterium]
MSVMTKLQFENISDREKTRTFAADTFGISEKDAPNLDALADCLSEVTEETAVKVGREALIQICKDDYAYRFLRVLSAAADENPHLHLLITR